MSTAPTKAKPYSKRRYGSPFTYEDKLDRVAKRLGVEIPRSSRGWTGDDAWVEFDYKQEHYRFYHSVGQSDGELQHGSDCFCQLVLTLEDIARMVERGIYDLQVYVAGMKALPAPGAVPPCFRAMGFEQALAGDGAAEQVESRYRELARTAHPDAGGSDHQMQQLNLWREQCLLEITWTEKVRS